MSLSVWGAWIEIAQEGPAVIPTSRRSPYGERGLKLNEIWFLVD